LGKLKVKKNAFLLKNDPVLWKNEKVTVGITALSSLRGLIKELVATSMLD